MSERICTVTDCGNPVKRKALCYGHYMKQWRYGTTDPVFEPKAEDLSGKQFGLLTALERRGSHWLCRCECGQETIVTVGSLNCGQTRTCGNRTEHRRRDDIEYSTAHQRVTSDRGQAQAHNCVDCGGQAKHWSYNHTDPNERISQIVAGIPYSTDPTHYSPRCVQCHKHFDLRYIHHAA